MKIETAGWKHVGESINSQYYEIRAGVLAAVPREGALDDLASAQSNVAFQNGHFREHGAGVVIVFADLLASQDKDARRVYQSEPDPDLMLGTALVGGSLLARAIGSFFLGLARPEIPVKMLATLDQALSWATHLHQAHQRKVGQR